MRAFYLAAAALLCTSCFRSAHPRPGDGMDDGGGGGGQVRDGTAGEDRAPDARSDALAPPGDGDQDDDSDPDPSTGLAGSTADDVPIEDEDCPERGRRPSLEECNLLEDDCPDGLACYAYAHTPEDRCDTEQFGTVCITGGTGTQGQACGDSLCAPGHACVTGIAGTRCLQNCQLDNTHACPPGLVCLPIDIAGVGVCS